MYEILRRLRGDRKDLVFRSHREVVLMDRTYFCSFVITVGRDRGLFDNGPHVDLQARCGCSRTSGIKSKFWITSSWRSKELEGTARSSRIKEGKAAGHIVLSLIIFLAVGSRTS